MLHEIIDTGIRHKKSKQQSKPNRAGGSSNINNTGGTKRTIGEQEKLDKDMNNDKCKQANKARPCSAGVTLLIQGCVAFALAVVVHIESRHIRLLLRQSCLVARTHVALSGFAFRSDRPVEVSWS